jgi:hypothetical protein
MLELTSSKVSISAGNTRKRSNDDIKSSSKAEQQEYTESSLSWTDKYRPVAVSDLPVHYSKVGFYVFNNAHEYVLLLKHVTLLIYGQIRALRDWLGKAMSTHEAYFNTGSSFSMLCLFTSYSYLTSVKYSPPLHRSNN